MLLVLEQVLNGLQLGVMLFLMAAGLMPLIREDTGVLLVAVGFWLLVRHRQRWPLALALISWGGGWVLLCTNVLMSLFSDDNAKRFMVENFGQYLSDGNSDGSSNRMRAKPLNGLTHLLVVAQSVSGFKITIDDCRTLNRRN